MTSQSMRNFLRVFAFILMTFAACRGSAGQKDILVTGYGEWRCYSNLWVFANQSDSKISIKRLDRGGGILQTAADWKTGKGWFVFAETSERIWIYNGTSLRLLLIKPDFGSTIYGCDYPVAIPSQVKKRIAG